MVEFIGQFGPLILLGAMIARGVWIYHATPQEHRR